MATDQSPPSTLQAYMNAPFASFQQLFAAANEHATLRSYKICPVAHSVYKRHLLNYARECLDDAFFNFSRMRRDGVTELHGGYPNQYLLVTHAQEPLNQWTSFNNGLGNEEAFSEAIRQSMSLSAPTELCCPITLEVFRDPVATMRGTVYERKAIEEWFTKHNTDPCSNQRLLSTVVYPDATMQDRVDDFLSGRSNRKDDARGGRAGRGRGGRGRGRRGRA